MIFRRSMQAFTLIELITALSIMAVLITVAIPFFGQITRNTNLQTQTEAAEGLLKYARTQAITTRKTYEVRIDSPSEWSVWQVGAAQAERTHAFNLDQVEPKVSALANDRWIFDAHGAVRQAGSMVLCHNNEFKSGRMISVRASGAVTVSHPGQNNNNPPSALTRCTP